jgi:hypothetical protein
MVYDDCKNRFYVVLGYSCALAACESIGRKEKLENDQLMGLKDGLGNKAVAETDHYASVLLYYPDCLAALWGVFGVVGIGVYREMELFYNKRTTRTLPRV